MNKNWRLWENKNQYNKIEKISQLYHLNNKYTALWIYFILKNWS